MIILKSSPTFKYKIIKIVENKEKYIKKLKTEIKNDILYYFGENDIIKKIDKIKL